MRLGTHANISSITITLTDSNTNNQQLIVNNSDSSLNSTDQYKRDLEVGMNAQRSVGFNQEMFKRYVELLETEAVSHSSLIETFYEIIVFRAANTAVAHQVKELNILNKAIAGGLKNFPEYSGSKNLTNEKQDFSTNSEADSWSPENKFWANALK